MNPYVGKGRLEWERELEKQERWELTHVILPVFVAIAVGAAIVVAIMRWYGWQ